MPKKIKISAIGAVVVDMISVIENFPEQDSKIKTTNTIFSTGGPAFTALCMSSKLGASTTFLSPIGNDEWKKFILADASIFKTKIPFIGEGSNQFANIWVNKKNGSRTIVWGTHNILYKSIDMDLIENEIKNSDMLFLDGHHMELAIESAKFAKKYNIPILYDAGSHKENEEKLFRYITYFIASKRFFSDNYKIKLKNMQKKYKNMKLVGITLGEFGGYIRSTNQTFTFNSTKNKHIVDTTGAGDIFHGTLGYYLSKKNDINSAINKAAYYSSLSCSHYGSINAVKKIKIS